MSEQNSTDPTRAQIESIQAQLDALGKRVTDLEATLKHEHEDLLALKEVADEDHRELQHLKGPPPPSGPPPLSSTPLGL